MQHTQSQPKPSEEVKGNRDTDNKPKPKTNEKL